METFVECSSLVVSDNDISTSDTATFFPLTNYVGYTNSNRSDRTWFNIDMKEVVGPDLYDQYEYFNLRLSAIVYNAPGTWGSTEDDRAFNFIVEGLPFVNNTYSVQTKTNTGQCIIGNTILVSGTSARSLVFDSTWMATFYRCATINLRIFFQKIDRTAFNLGTATMFPRFTFYFTIFPVK